MKQSWKWGAVLVAAASLALSGCSSSSDEASATPTNTPEPVTLTMAAWLLDSTPEFKTLTDAFHAQNPNVTIELVEYVAGNDYDTQMIADLAAGTAPDLYILKNLRNFYTYQDGGQLMDVSDVASGLDANSKGVSNYVVDGKTWAIPYRQDSWYLYYDKDLFDQAGVAYPDGTWLWADYVAAAEDLSTALGSDVYGAYLHRWQSCVQGLASAQSPGSDILSGDFGYMEPFYDRAVLMQDDGSVVPFNTSSTNSLSYQAEFGQQRAAMTIMGSWFVAAYLQQVKTGDANAFEWGIAPVPQSSSAATANPITFGDPTAIGINPKIDPAKVEAAKQFLAFVASEGGAIALADIGITPAFFNDAVTDAYFAGEGIPGDDLSRFTFSTHDTKPENPVSANTAAIQSILGDMHTAIMSESASVKDAIAEAERRARDEVLNN